MSFMRQHIELELEVFYDYQPAIYDGPGCKESAVINAVMVRGSDITGALSKDEIRDLEFCCLTRERVRRERQRIAREEQAEAIRQTEVRKGK